MPKLIKKRAGKKSSTGENLKERVGDIREGLKERQRSMVYGLAAFLVVVTTVAVFVVYTRTSAANAHKLEFEGQDILYGRTAAQYPNPADRVKNALEKFKKSYEAKKNPAVLLQIADCYYALNDYDQAIAALNDLNGRYSDTHILSLSYYKLASAYIKKGDNPGALKAYDNIASLKDSGLQDLALLDSGRLLESMGKNSEAKAKYDELMKKFPNSRLLINGKGSGTDLKDEKNKK